MYNLVSFFGIFVLMAFAWTLSTNRKIINWHAVMWGTALQLIFAVFIFIVPVGSKVFLIINDAVVKVQDLASALAAQTITHQRSAVIATYALCGFAHIPSVAIFVGGTAALAPTRTRDLAQVGFRAFAAATLACLMIAAVAGTFYTQGSILLNR